MVGILLGYLTSYLFINDVGGWRMMYGVALFPAVVLLAGMVCQHYHARCKRSSAIPDAVAAQSPNCSLSIGTLSAWVFSIQSTDDMSGLVTVP